MIFVTGGTGLVGSHLLLQLIEKGEKVRALKRPESNIRLVENFFKLHKSQEIFHKIEWIEGDILDITFLPKALTGVTTIFHTAAMVSFDPKDEDQVITTNVNGTENLINQAIDAGVENFIFLSSIAALDDINPVTKIIDENSTWNNDISHSAYAISKYRSEMEVWRGSQEGLNVIVLNPSVIIGSFDGNRESERLFKNHFINQYAPSGGTGFVDVRDVTAIMIRVYEEKLYHQRFIINAENRLYLDVLKHVATHKNLTVTPISNLILKSIYLLSTPFRWFGLPSLNKATYNALTSFSKYDNSKIKSTLDYHFIPIEEALDYHFKKYQEIISTK